MTGAKRISSRVVYRGRTVSTRIDEFRYEDGDVSEREVVAHPGAVAIVAHDGELLYLVRHLREAVGEDDLLELPAGKLDVDGETPLGCARRELEEETSVRAGRWSELKRFYTSPGFTDEEVWIFLATELEDLGGEPDPGERLELVRWPLAELDGAIDACRDAKSLIGLLLLRRMLGEKGR